jgi:hypothetical protein
MADENGNGGGGSYLLFVWSPAGWELREQQGEPPAVGEQFTEGDRTLVVSKVGASPLPGDSRVCVYSLGA